jgi:multidrug efflux pump subunit AcrA (membrane-fusion protein)
MRNFIILLIIFAALLMLASCLPKEEAPLPPPVVKSYEPEPPTIAAVKRGELISTVKISPAYSPVSEQNYYFSAAGYFIDTVFVKQGDEVHAGDLLAKLDTSDLTFPIADAEYDLRQQQLNYSYLGESNAATTQLDIAKLKLQSLREQEAARYIYANADGVAAYVKVFRPDSRSAANDRVITVADVSYAAYSLGGSGTQYLTAGQAYTLTINGIDYEAEAIENNGSFTFYPEVPLSEAAKYASITLELDRRDDTLYLPSSAVKFTTEGTYVVYILNSAGVRELHPVEIGLRVSGKTEILSGLEEGDEVIVG